MKILYDHQIFHRQKHGGITRYFVELIKGLKKIGNNEIQISIENTDNEYIKDLSDFVKFKNDSNHRKNYSYISKIFLKKNNSEDIIRHSAKIIRDGDYDIFHPTFYDHYFLEYIGTKKYVLTVHDLIFQKYPEFFTQYEIPDKSTKILEGASHIIVISENTKHDLLNYYSIDENKISVIYHGAPQKKDILLDDVEKFDCEYLLYVGDRRGYKNFYSFLISIKEALHFNNNLNLICVGIPFDVFEIKLFEFHNLKDKIFNLSPDDNNLQSLYENAVALVYPSIDEGFGLPILEAFVYGCPVLCSDIKIFHEIANDSVIYFDPKSIKSINEAFYRVYNSQKEKQLLIEKGYLRSKLFSWENCAELTEKVYRQVINQE
jgi:glycosyltransferase involved in cell wall biosynthesis